MEPEHKATKLLRYSVETSRRVYQLGEPIHIKATLVNVGADSIAVFARELLRYCNYERLPIARGSFSAEGQVVGDSPDKDHLGAPTVLGPKESLSKQFDIARLVKVLAQKPGKYRLSVDYCHDSPASLDGVIAPVGCVRSNDVLIEITPAD